jgi:hypothetical protein
VLFKHNLTWAGIPLYANDELQYPGTKLKAACNLTCTSFSWHTSAVWPPKISRRRAAQGSHVCTVFGA